MEFKERVTLVTGASRGIGRAVSVMLAAEGGRVALGGRDEGALAETAEGVRAVGGEPLVVPLDVGSDGSVKQGVARVKDAWGRIDGLVNNAGISRDGLLMRARNDDWNATLETNLGGVFRMTREVIPIMIRARAGRIVSVASVIGETGNAGQTAYAASKAGIIGFTKSLAREVASRSITANCVTPGFIETEMTEALPEKGRQDMLTRIPLGRAGTVEDVAGSIRFLLSDAASYITGAVLRVNGGLYM